MPERVDIERGVVIDETARRLALALDPSRDRVGVARALASALASVEGVACAAVVGAEGRVEAVDPAAPPGARPPWMDRGLGALSGLRDAGGIRTGVESLAEGRSVLVGAWGVGGEREGGGVLVLLAGGGDAGVARVLVAMALGMLAQREALGAEGRGREASLEDAMLMSAAAGERTRALAAGVAFCDEAATRFGCARVTFGIARPRGVRLVAMNHGEKPARSTRLVHELENAMDECADQEMEVVVPGAGWSDAIARSAGELASSTGLGAVLAVPVRGGGGVAGVLLLERDGSRPWREEEVRTLRLACELAGPRLADLFEHDRWFGARVARDVRRLGAAVVGPRHTWAKLVSVVVAALLLASVFVHGEDTAAGTFALEVTQRRAVASPFDGELAWVGVEAGDRVRAGETVLARMETADVLLALGEARAARRAALTDAAAARAEGRTSEAQIAQARADGAGAEVALLERRLGRAELVAPIDGVVLEGVAGEREGAPVARGEMLFELGTPDRLRAEIAVPEARIGAVEAGQRGELAASAFPGRRVGFEVERVRPVAREVAGRTVFVVEARLDRVEPWMRPGMEGVAEVVVGEARLIELWTRGLTDWLRLRVLW